MAKRRKGVHNPSVFAKSVEQQAEEPSVPLYFLFGRDPRRHPSDFVKSVEQQVEEPPVLSISYSVGTPRRHHKFFLDTGDPLGVLAGLGVVNLVTKGASTAGIAA